ncbi:FUN14 domain-containing protein [Candidatus Bathyarchaeota archaeon]|nr:FUN14 domain-containing protein [Candidatus Bathyarchaeota archaeon]
MEDLLAPVLFMLMVGGVSGYFAGQLVKRASGMALTIGVVVVTLIILAYAGTVNVNLDTINASIVNFFGVLATLGIIALVSSVPFVASFIAGLFLGFRRD